MKRGKSNWRTLLDEKMAMVQEIDSQVKERDAILDRDFDVLGLKHRHEDWLDSYHQKLARIEMDLREKESQIPAIRNQTIQHEKLLENYNISLRDTYGDRLETLTHSSRNQPTISNEFDRIIHEGWLIEVSRSHSRKYFKLVPASSTSPLRLYGFESDYTRTPISIVQILRKSTVAQNSVTKDYTVSPPLASPSSLPHPLPALFAVLLSITNR
jgi:hypothetical protein